MSDIDTTVEELLDTSSGYDDDGDEKIKKKRFNVCTSFYGKSFDTYEEAEAYVNKTHKRDPFSSTTYFIAEIISASKSVPVAETSIKSIDMRQYYNQKQLEKNNGI